MLYIVSTPIGNLKDITYRAVETLGMVDYILCEDTRRASILLNHYDIKKPLRKYEKFSERKSVEGIINELENGKDIALISDAGTPIISDPGNILTQELKARNIKWTAVGGQCALINGLVLSGLSSHQFCFLGFLPEKNIDRKKLFQEYAEVSSALVIYISPHSVEKDIVAIHEHLGARNVCLVREISKMYEESISFTLPNLPEDSILKGEMVLVIEGNKKQKFEDLSVVQHFEMYVSQGIDEKTAMKLVASDKKLSKSEVYSHIKVK